MRERLYKAKSKENGDWVYGFYYEISFEDKNDTMYCIRSIDNPCVQINPDSLCEYIKKDCKGNKVFEHDIVKFEYIDLEIGTIKAKGEIVWHEDSASYLIYLPYECKHFDIGFHLEMEVVGNIFNEGKFNEQRKTN